MRFNAHVFIGVLTSLTFLMVLTIFICLIIVGMKVLPLKNKLEKLESNVNSIDWTKLQSNISSVNWTQLQTNVNNISTQLNSISKKLPF